MTFEPKDGLWGGQRLYSHTVLDCIVFFFQLSANRTEPNLADVFQAFRDLGINLSDLAEFTQEVESLPPPEPIPRYPVPRSSTHIYHAPSGGKPAVAGRRARTGSLSSEDESDRDHIPPYLPPLPLEAEEDKGTVHIYVSHICMANTQRTTVFVRIKWRSN